VTCFSLGTPLSSTNKTDCHDITEIWLKGALNTVTLTLKDIKKTTTVITTIGVIVVVFNAIFNNISIFTTTIELKYS
jgi:hypothetical protein